MRYYSAFYALFRCEAESKQVKTGTKVARQSNGAVLPSAEEKSTDGGATVTGISTRAAKRFQGDGSFSSYRQNGRPFYKRGLRK
jgi:hypothetical protein